MADKLSTLPTELVLIILSHLPLRSLLAFGATCRLNYERHVLSVKSLRLAVFQRRLYSIISFIQAGWVLPGDMLTLDEGPEGADVDCIVSIILPRTSHVSEDSLTYPLEGKEWRIRQLMAGQERPRSLAEMVRIQNSVFSKVLSRYGGSLCHLELMAYDLNMEGAAALGMNCGASLRHLALRFEHPHVRDGITRPEVWFGPPPASTAWNALGGIGTCKQFGNVTRLKTLVLERAGITPWQLLRLVKRNPEITTLKLRTCNGAQPEFLYWLGGLAGAGDGEEDGSPEEESNQDIHAPGARLKVLWLENCTQILSNPSGILDNRDESADTCDRGLEWVRGLKSLEVSCYYEEGKRQHLHS